MAPFPLLGSNSNYVLSSAQSVSSSTCSPIINLSVTINVTEDIVGGAGFSFQLNANSRGKNIWQQYVISLDQKQGTNGKLSYFIDNTQPDGTQRPYGSGVLIDDLPSPVLPHGYTLTISLQTDPVGNVNQVQFVVLDGSNNTLANPTIPLASLPNVTSADLAPIVAFQVILGTCPGSNPLDHPPAVLFSGGGTITYIAGAPTP